MQNIFNASPFGILGDKSTNIVKSELGIDGTVKFSFTDMGFGLQTVIFYGGLITSILSAILLLFFRGNEKQIAEHKRNICHKLLIIWLAASAVTIFNILKIFMDDIFGL